MVTAAKDLILAIFVGLFISGSDADYGAFRNMNPAAKERTSSAGPEPLPVRNKMTYAIDILCSNMAR